MYNGQTMSRVIVSGSIAYDLIMDFPGFFRDSILPDKLHSLSISFMVDRLSEEFGGTAGNISYNLAMLGVQSDIISTAGNDFSRYKNHMLESGVDPTTIAIKSDALTASAHIITDRADNQIAAFHPGASAFAFDTPINLEGRACAIIAPGCVADMTSLPTFYRERNFKFYYDPAQQIPALSGEQLQDGITGAQALFGTDYEITLIMDKTGWNEAAILQRTPMIVSTRGAQGSEIVTREDRIQVPAAKVANVSDPTGAGDAYRAGFVKGILAGVSLAECAALASTVAAYTVEMYGTQTHKFTIPDLAKRYEESYGSKLPISA